MIKSLEIKGLRGLQQFSLGDLGRVNLLVGTNNCGKSTVLEGIQILSSPGSLEPLYELMTQRGEILSEVSEQGLVSSEIDIRRLFFGHQLNVGTQFSVKAETPHDEQLFTAEVLDYQSAFESQPKVVLDLPNPPTSQSHFQSFPSALRAYWSELPGLRSTTAISSNGGLLPRFRGEPFDNEKRDATRLITPFALAPWEVVRLFESVVLTAEEDFVVEALRVIDPSIERLAIGGIDARRLPSGVSARGGLLVRCTGNKNRIPIGSMGDGIWRMLGLALAIVKAEGGVLLVDEIDTGLHYTTMTDMWRMIYRTAKRLDVQVFATTHSRDCVESLATICREESPTEGEVTIQRIERDRATSVSYTEDEIIAVAERGLEVR